MIGLILDTEVRKLPFNEDFYSQLYFPKKYLVTILQQLGYIDEKEEIISKKHVYYSVHQISQDVPDGKKLFLLNIFLSDNENRKDAKKDWDKGIITKFLESKSTIMITDVDGDSIDPEVKAILKTMVTDLAGYNDKIAEKIDEKFKEFMTLLMGKGIDVASNYADIAPFFTNLKKMVAIDITDKQLEKVQGAI